jgi:hypothetical protein
MKSRLTQYIFIDPSSQSTELRFVHLDVEAMLSIIGCQSLEAIALSSGDIIWFDGEPVEYDVELDGVEVEGTPILGSRCMITGPVDRKTEMPTYCRLTARDALAMIRWMPQRKIVGETFQLTKAGFEIEYVFESA